jgi:hypothetical protein
MKAARINLLMCAVMVAAVCSDHACAAETARTSETDILELKAVPDGHYRVNLLWNRQERSLNVEVKGNRAKCVNTTEERLKGLEGEFRLIGNGVFLIFFQNEHHRASQFWVFRRDGSAAVREVPDRGEKQSAVPVENDALDAPRRNP